MDLLFKRYASPFILLDNLIATNSLTLFIIDMLDIVNEEKLLEYFMHKVFDKSWNDAGWLFLDYRNNVDSNDKNYIA